MLHRINGGTRYAVPLPMVVMLSVLASFSLFAQPPDNLPYARRGSYPVGTREIVVDDGEGRAVNATVWYPALNPDNLEESNVFQQAIFRITGHATPNAEPDTASAPYPLVIVSHGSGTLRWLHLYLTEHLASYGFVVVAPEHTGNTLADTLRPREFAETVITSYVTRPRDTVRTIRYVSTLDWLQDVVDMERIAVTGHSFGGYTALAAAGGQWDFAGLQAWCDDHAGSALDPYPDVPLFPAPTSPEATYGACFLLEHGRDLAAQRGLDAVPDGLWERFSDLHIQAVVTFAPWNGPIWGEAGLSGVTIPALVMVGAADHVTPAERDAFYIYERLGSSQKMLVTFDGADHFIFLDECPAFLVNLNQTWACSDPVWDMAEAHAVINHTVTAFLLAALYDETSAAPSIPVEVTGVTFTMQPE